MGGSLFRDKLLGARTLESAARFTVHPAGQIGLGLISQETRSILTPYGAHGEVGFSLNV